MIFDSKKILKEMFINKEEEDYSFFRTIGDNNYQLIITKCCNEYFCEMGMNADRIASNFFKLSTKKSIDDMQFKLYEEYMRDNKWSNKKYIENIKELLNSLEKQNEEFGKFCDDYNNEYGMGDDENE